MDVEFMDEDRKPAAVEKNVVDANGTSVKPALKTGGRRRSSAQSMANANATQSQSPTNKQLKWDEQVIEEHDLLRGTRMKIDEPNTPYTYYDSGSESDNSRRPKSPANQKPTLSWDNLQNRLNSVAAVQEQLAPLSPALDQAKAEQSSDAEEEERSDMRVLEFREHRKRHYNEMELVRQFRQQQQDSDDDDNNGDQTEAVAQTNGGNYR